MKEKAEEKEADMEEEEKNQRKEGRKKKRDGSRRRMGCQTRYSTESGFELATFRSQQQRRKNFLLQS